MKMTVLRYHTDKLVSKSIKNIIILYSDIIDITFSRLLFFPAVSITTGKEKYQFIIYSPDKILRAIKNISPSIIIK